MPASPKIDLNAVAQSLPSYISQEAWGAYIEMRKAKGSRAPITMSVIKLLLGKLDKIHADGHDANAALEESVISGWTGVWPVRCDRILGGARSASRLSVALGELQEHKQ